MWVRFRLPAQHGALVVTMLARTATLHTTARPALPSCGEHRGSREPLCHVRMHVIDEGILRAQFEKTMQ